ncbi:MAG TPA: amidohydrolase family protein [Gemmatimonadaceae bacterium]
MLIRRAATLALLTASCARPGAESTAYSGATVLDGTGRVIQDAVIIESGGHIVAIGPRDSVPLPRGAATVSLDGRWIIPGLIDGHAHAGESTVARYLSYGVTSVRHVGGSLDRLTSLARRIAADSISGPRLYIAGETLTGPPQVWPGQVVLNTPAEVLAEVGRLASGGVSQIKLYTHTTRELMEAVVAQARTNKLPVTAHLGYVDAITAAQLGVNALEHLSGVVESTVPDPAPFFRAHETFPTGWMTFLRGWATLDSVSLERTAIALAKTGVTLVPTLVQSETYARVLDSTYAGSLDLSAVTAAEQQAWDLPDLVRRYGITREDMEPLAQARRWQDFFIRRFAALGGKVVAGSDSPNQLLAPGASLHEELSLLVRTGMTPAEALHSATAGAAALLRTDSIGVLKPGAVADFVVLSESPLANIRSTRLIAAVIARGRQHVPSDLRQQ